jgi:hypothetical protein
MALNIDISTDNDIAAVRFRGLLGLSTLTAAAWEY